MPENVNVLSYEARVKRAISSMQYIVDYDYDTEQELWCKLKLAVSMPFFIIFVVYLVNFRFCWFVNCDNLIII
jgi:hypothetical protein